MAPMIRLRNDGLLLPLLLLLRLILTSLAHGRENPEAISRSGKLTTATGRLARSIPSSEVTTVPSTRDILFYEGEAYRYLNDFTFSLSSYQVLDEYALNALLTDYLTAFLSDTFDTLTDVTLILLTTTSDMGDSSEQIAASYTYGGDVFFVGVIPEQDDVSAAQTVALEDANAIQEWIDARNDIGTNVTVDFINVANAPLPITPVRLHQFQLVISGTGRGLDNSILEQLLQLYLYEGMIPFYPQLIQLYTIGFSFSSTDTHPNGFTAVFLFECTAYFLTDKMESKEELLLLQAELISNTTALQDMVDTRPEMGIDLVIDHAHIILVSDSSNETEGSSDSSVPPAPSDHNLGPTQTTKSPHDGGPTSPNQSPVLPPDTTINMPSSKSTTRLLSSFWIGGLGLALFGTC